MQLSLICPLNAHQLLPKILLNDEVQSNCIFILE